MKTILLAVFGIGLLSLAVHVRADNVALGAPNIGERLFLIRGSRK